MLNPLVTWRKETKEEKVNKGKLKASSLSYTTSGLSYGIFYFGILLLILVKKKITFLFQNLENIQLFFPLGFICFWNRTLVYLHTLHTSVFVMNGFNIRVVHKSQSRALTCRFLFASEINVHIKVSVIPIPKKEILIIASPAIAPYHFLVIGIFSFSAHKPSDRDWRRFLLKKLLAGIRNAPTKMHG